MNLPATTKNKEKKKKEHDEKRKQDKYSRIKRFS
jgi:hypothetical protein